MTDTARLERLLKLFFGFERPEIVGFRRAVAQFKTDLPAVLKGLEPYYAAIRAAAAQIGRWCSAGANCGATRSAGLGSTRAARIHD
jgi:hypothetical protein